MTTTFRNIEFDSDSPVDEWPAEAIETIVDRGTLSDWRRLADAIRRSPWGPAARTVEKIAGWGEHYGADALMSSVIRRAREEVDLGARALYASEIRSWRVEAGMTLRQFARAAGTSASRLSDYENAKVAPTTDILGRLRYIAAIHRAARSAVSELDAERLNIAGPYSPDCYHDVAMRRMMFQADDELLSRAKRLASERGVSVAQVVRDALEKELGGSGQTPPPASIIGIGSSGRTDLSRLASEDEYEPEPWRSS